MKFLAFWVFPDGFVLPVEDHHVDEVIKTPERFGLTLKKITAVYEKHHEKLHVEGDARIELFRALLKIGFIRIRHVERPGDCFTIEVYKLDNTTNQNIINWAAAITRRIDNWPKYTGYCISEIRPGGKSVSGVLKDLVK
jgi:threonine aldolase